MPCYDAVADDFLLAYLHASERYADAVDELTELVGSGHTRFMTNQKLVRKLATEVEEAHSALMKHREDVKPTRQPHFVRR